MIQNYSPEIDQSAELDTSDVAYYQSLIGILRWLVEMGRIDISMEVSSLSSYVAMPRIGHLGQVFHIFAYLKGHHIVRLVLNPSYPVVDEKDYATKDWSGLYGEEKESTPPNAPKLLGKEFVMRAFVDASFAGCKMTRRSRTGFVVFLNCAPIYWMSKKQGSCEISTFGSEFVAMRTCCEYVRGIRYKLRMMGILVSLPTLIYGDSQSVLWNTTVPDSTLKKKSSDVVYHYCREGTARSEWITNFISRTNLNPSDILTKTVHTLSDRARKVRSMLYDIHPTDKERDVSKEKSYRTNTNAKA